MNVLYIIYGNYLVEKESGVALKIIAKTEALRQVGVNIKVVNFSNTAKEQQQLNDFCSIVPITQSSAFSQIGSYLSEYLVQFDAVLFRYPFADEGLLKLVEQFPGKIIFEHNTFEQEEMLLVQKRHFKKLPVSLKPSYLKYWWRTYISKTTAEKQYGPGILQKARAGICVTNELAAYESRRCRAYKTFVVSNGASPDISAISEVPKYNNAIKGFMLVGDHASWQGFERIISGLKKFSNPAYNIEIAVIGIDNPYKEDLVLPANCKLVFLKKSDRFFEAYDLQRYHIAFSTLALYKKGMHEAASLKLRDNMLRGFPMVLGYRDTDVMEHKAFAPYTLQVPNDDSPLDFGNITAFYERVRQIENYPGKIRELAVQTFSYKVKALQIKDILENKV